MMVLLLRNIFVAAVPIIDEPASELFVSCTQLLFILLSAALQTNRADDIVVGNLLPDCLQMPFQFFF